MNFNLLFRKFHSGLFFTVRKIHMRRYVRRLKKSNSSSWILTRGQKKAAKDYFKHYCSISPLFHNFYTEKTGNYFPNYIPDDIYFNNINHFYNDHQLAKNIDHKGYYHAVFPDIPQPYMIACRKAGYWYRGNDLISHSQLFDLLRQEQEVFIKLATDSGGGSGVHYMEPAESENLEQTFYNIIQSMNGDLVIQRALRQHPSIALLNPSSVNTLRLVSLLRDDEVTIYSSILRMGSHGAKVDNSSSGGLSVGINDSGTLKEYAYYTNGTRLTEHPSSGVVFKDYQIPSFSEAQSLVKKAHWYIPHFRLVSWDIAINQDGTPILIEANMTDGQLDFHQLNNGPLFGKDTRIILDEVFSK